jgi:hypothetical protein
VVLLEAEAWKQLRHSGLLCTLQCCFGCTLLGEFAAHLSRSYLRSANKLAIYS